MKRYDPQQIEPHWQQVWSDTNLYAAIDGDQRQKCYYLMEFPYPSGEGLHVGHVLGYTAVDIMARHKRMQGFNVLYPIGFDEFGLPTENFAIKHKIAPQVATDRNVATFRKQLKSLGLSFDWDREVRTSDPQYYRWTQWIFLRLLRAGLAYQAEMPINWCPFEKTGLANEEVVDGKHERCGTPVEKKLLKQWMLRITAYADQLSRDLATVDYLDRIASQQINWIGKSEGAEISFAVTGLPAAVEASVTVYTTRPDTIFGATFLVVSPEVAQGWTEAGWKAPASVSSYVETALKASELSRQEDKSKTGVDTGLQAKHPLSGEALPVWVADYVLGSYGTGAIMAVPAHDNRDAEFAKAFGLPIVTVVEPITGQPQTNPEQRLSIVALVKNRDGKFLSINWGKQGGLLFVGGGRNPGEDGEDCARREVLEETGYKNLKLLGTSEVIHHHYFAHSKGQAREIEAIGYFFELEDDAQDQPHLEADEVGKFTVEWLDAAQAERQVTDPLHAYLFGKFERGQQYTGYGPLTNSGSFNGLSGDAAKSAIARELERLGVGKVASKYKLRDWIFSRQHYWGEPIPVVHCPQDGVVPVPDDQLPVVLPTVDSYEPTDNGESPLAAITDWVNTTCPTCGGPAKRETDTMPNWAGSSWYYLRYTDAHNDQAFASQENLAYWTPVDLYNGGMEHTTLHLLYSRFWHKFLYDQKLVPTPEPYARRRSHGMILGPDGVKMSKSRGNVINPDHVVAKYGADTIRLYEMFMGPFDEQKIWSEEHLAGVSRFIYRVWALAQDFIHGQQLDQSAPSYEANMGSFAIEIDRSTHKTLKKVHQDIETMSFNTAVSALMEHVNVLNRPENKSRLMQDNATDVRGRTIRHLILMLAPFVPHLAEELWRELGEAGSVHVAVWPSYDPALMKDDVVTIIVQVNGKVRASLVAAADASETELVAAATADPRVATYLAQGDVLKTVVVPRKLVNFVIKN